MNDPRFLLIAALWLAAWFSAHADEPLIQLPTGNFACQIAVSPHSDQPASTPPAKPEKGIRQVSIAIVRTGHLFHDTVTWNDGHTTEIWIQVKTGMMQVERERGQTILDLGKGTPGREFFLSPPLTFEPEWVAWIVQHNQQPATPVDHNGKSALHYQTEVELPRPDAPPEIATWQAWIDPKSHAPLAFDDGTYLYDLTFSLTPPAALTLPERFKADLQHYQNANAPLQHL